MAGHRLVLIHTVPSLVEVFTRLAARELPGVALLHVLDEPLLERVRQKGMLDGEDVERLAGHVREAALVGADAVLVTCSTVSPAVDGARAQALFPVLKIDEAMVAEAVRLAALSGGRIGVIATNPTTLAPTCALIEAHAAQAGIQVTTETYMVEGALGYLLKGNTDYHDVLVETDARFRQMVGEDAFAVNTFHHQGMDRASLAPIFRPAAIAHPDAWLVEAYESQAHRWVVGVQWHPERGFELGQAHRRLWQSFISACTDRAAYRKP